MTDEKHDFLLQNYKGINSTDLTDKINKKFNTNLTVTQIKTYKKTYHLRSEYTHRYQKGNIPLTKGKKGVLSEGYERSWFKKGRIPPNRKPIGSERNANRYIELKVSEPDVWKHKHRVIWEQVHGEIPKGMVIIFLNGDKLNTDISNLKLISREELLIMNHNKLFQPDRDLTDISINYAKMIDAKNKAKKRQKERPQS